MIADNCRPFAWNQQRLQAAELLADGELTDLQIAEQVNISIRQLRNWKHHPEFQAKVASYVQLLEAAMLKLAIAQRRKRVASQNERWQKLHTITEERGQDESMQDVPGGKTGLIVRTLKAIGVGKNQQIIEEYSVDRGLLAELRALEEHSAKELGQWSEKQEITVTLRREVERLANELGLDPDEILAEAEAILKAERT